MKIKMKKELIKISKEQIQFYLKKLNMNNFYQLLKIKKIDLKDNYLIIFRNLKIDLSKEKFICLILIIRSQKIGNVIRN